MSKNLQADLEKSLKGDSAVDRWELSRILAGYEERISRLEEWARDSRYRDLPEEDELWRRS